MDPVALLIKTVLITAVFEGVTALFRFGFGLRSSEATSFLQKLTFNLRIHHGYVGFLLLCVTIPVASSVPLFGWCLATWLGLLLSDLIHHFLVLWPVTGSPEFDLFYPDGS